MDCNQVRDQFSSLLEGDLKPQEEEKAREHLASCHDCQKEWEQFNRMMNWLHTAREEDVPKGFLEEIQKKREARKGKEIRTGAWFLRSAKIPIQAAAMVMIVFLALYLNKMAPFDTVEKRAVEKPEVAESSRDKEAPVLREEVEQKKRSVPPPLDRKDYVLEAKSPVADEKAGAKDSMVQKMKEEVKEAVAPVFKEEMASPKVMVKAEAPRPEESRGILESTGGVRMSFSKREVREITLRINDPEKAFTQIQDVTKRMGGDIVKEEGDVLLATLPISAYMEFEKELAKIGTLSITLPFEGKDDLSSSSRSKGKESITLRVHLVTGISP